MHHRPTPRPPVLVAPTTLAHHEWTLLHTILIVYTAYLRGQRPITPTRKVTGQKTGQSYPFDQDEAPLASKILAIIRLTTQVNNQYRGQPSLVMAGNPQESASHHLQQEQRHGLRMPSNQRLHMQHPPHHYYLSDQNGLRKNRRGQALYEGLSRK